MRSWVNQTLIRLASCDPPPPPPCLQDRLEHLRQQCGPHVAAVAKDSVEGICSKIYQLSAEYSRRLRQTHLSLLQDPPTGEPAAGRPAHTHP